MTLETVGLETLHARIFHSASYFGNTKPLTLQKVPNTTHQDVPQQKQVMQFIEDEIVRLAFS